jgi:hypothetical protein
MEKQEIRKRDAIILVQQRMKYTGVIVKYVGNQLSLMLGDYVIRSILKLKIRRIAYVPSENTSESVARITEAFNLPTCDRVFLQDIQGYCIINVDECVIFGGKLDSMSLPLDINNVLDVFTKLNNDGIPIEHFAKK